MLVSFASPLVLTIPWSRRCFDLASWVNLMKSLFFPLLAFRFFFSFFLSFYLHFHHTLPGHRLVSRFSDVPFFLPSLFLPVFFVNCLHIHHLHSLSPLSLFDFILKKGLRFVGIFYLFSTSLGMCIRRCSSFVYRYHVSLSLSSPFPLPVISLFFLSLVCLILGIGVFFSGLSLSSYYSSILSFFFPSFFFFI